MSHGAFFSIPLFSSSGASALLNQDVQVNNGFFIFLFFCILFHLENIQHQKNLLLFKLPHYDTSSKFCSPAKTHWHLAITTSWNKLRVCVCVCGRASERVYVCIRESATASLQGEYSCEGMIYESQASAHDVYILLRKKEATALVWPSIYVYVTHWHLRHGHAEMYLRCIDASSF